MNIIPKVITDKIDAAIDEAKRGGNVDLVRDLEEISTEMIGEWYNRCKEKDAYIAKGDKTPGYCANCGYRGAISFENTCLLCRQSGFWHEGEPPKVKSAPPPGKSVMGD